MQGRFSICLSNAAFVLGLSRDQGTTSMTSCSDNPIARYLAVNSMHLARSAAAKKAPAAARVRSRSEPASDAYHNAASTVRPSPERRFPQSKTNSAWVGLRPG